VTASTQRNTDPATIQRRLIITHRPGWQTSIDQAGRLQNRQWAGSRQLSPTARPANCGTASSTMLFGHTTIYVVFRCTMQAAITIVADPGLVALVAPHALAAGLAVVVLLPAVISLSGAGAAAAAAAVVLLSPAAVVVVLLVPPAGASSCCCCCGASCCCCGALWWCCCGPLLLLWWCC